MPTLYFHVLDRRMMVTCLLLVCMNFQVSGCLLLLGAGAGAGGAAYVMGKMVDEIDVPVAKLQRATVAGLRALEMPIVKEQGDKLTAEVRSKTADDSSVQISISSLAPSRSKISIRVGLIGDERRSRQILGAIRNHL